MPRSEFEITLELYSVISPQLETKTFYTVFLEIDQKEAELPKKKCSSLPGVVNFNDSLTLRVTGKDLQSTDNEAKLTIYSLQNYGQKKLFGKTNFKLDLFETQQLKLKLHSCIDSQAYIELRSSVMKIDSRITSNNTSTISQKNNVIDEADQKQHEQFMSLFKNQLHFPFKNFEENTHQNIKTPEIDPTLRQTPKTPFQLPTRSPPVVENDNSVSISKNLQLMENLQKALQSIDHQNLVPKLILNVEKKASPKDIMINKLSQMADILNQIHKKQDILKDDDRIQELISIQKSQRKAENEEKDKSLIILDTERSKLQLYSKKIHFNYFGKNIPVSWKTEEEIPQEQPQKKKKTGFLKLFHSVQTDGLLPLNKKVTAPSPPKSKRHYQKSSTKQQYNQQWEQDEEMAKVVHEMMNEVKGNLGYVKLSKLGQMSKKIKQIKDRNKMLIISNQELKNEKEVLQKKFQLAQQALQQKQAFLTSQFESLREQFKSVSKKLLNKYNEEIQREKKIKQFQKDIKQYEKQVKGLQEKLQQKNKQVLHFKQLLLADDEICKEKTDKTQKEDSTLEIAFTDFKKNSKGSEKDLKINSQSFKKELFPNRREMSQKTVEPFSFLLSDPAIETKKNIEAGSKGIIPGMAEFFYTHIAKPDQAKRKPAIPQPRKQLNLIKKTRLNENQSVLIRKSNADNPPLPSKRNQSSGEESLVDNSFRAI